MTKRLKVLWIEDSVQIDLPHMFGEVYASGKYDVTVAYDVSYAVSLLSHQTFEAIVIDIRLPPGNEPTWVAAYNDKGANKASARLGFVLADSLLNRDKAVIPIKTANTIKPAQIGFLSVERRTEVLEDLERLGITHYREKAVGDRSALRTLLDEMTKPEEA